MVSKKRVRRHVVARAGRAKSPPPAPTQVEKQNDTTPPSVRSLKWSHDGSFGGGSLASRPGQGTRRDE